MKRSEAVVQVSNGTELAPGVRACVLVSGHVGAQRLATGTLSMQPSTELPYHTHPCSEAITVLRGPVQALVEGRRYRLDTYDCVHIPAGVAHAVCNESGSASVLLHWAFATAEPTREFVREAFPTTDRAESDSSCPEHVTRFERAPEYDLASCTTFRDLFARRMGSRGICGGHGVFDPGSALPCHTHDFDESITIVAGRAVCQVAGQEYVLADYDTAFVPRGRPHRFINRSDEPMTMVWVYAGDEPDRVIVDPSLCERDRIDGPGST